MSSTQEVGDIFGGGLGPAQAMLRSPTVLIVSVGLWGMNLFFFKLFGIDYKTVLMYDILEMEYEEFQQAQQQRDPSIKDDSLPDATVSSGPGGLSSSAAAPTAKRKNTDDDSHPPFGVSSPSRISPTSTPGSSHDTSSSTSIELAQFQSQTQQPLQSSSHQTPSSSSQHTAEYYSSHYGISITWFKLVVFSIVLLFLLHFTTHFWIDHLGRSSIGAIFSFYAAVLVYIFLPIQSNQWLRRSFVIVLRRSFELIHPRCSYLSTVKIPRKIPFVDVFYADAMCSLSKVFFDWGMLLHQASHFPNPVPKEAHNIILPSMFAAVPYIIRARQCLIMYTIGRLKQDPTKHQHLMNAFKYSTSIFPLVLSAYQKTLLDDQAAAKYEGLLITLLIINASYSLYWDIVMDWGMMQDPYKVAQTACRLGYPITGTTTSNTSTVIANDPEITKSINDTSISTATTTSSSSATNDSNKGHHNNDLGKLHHHYHHCHHVCLRPRLRFGLTLSALIVVADAFLRFSWTLRFISKFPSNDAFVLCTQFLEVFRRAIWNLLRVEWENIKQKKASAKTPDSWSDHGPNQKKNSNNRRPVSRMLSSNHKKNDNHSHQPPHHRHDVSGSIDDLLFAEDEIEPLKGGNHVVTSSKLSAPPAIIDTNNIDPVMIEMKSLL